MAPDDLETVSRLVFGAHSKGHESGMIDGVVVAPPCVNVAKGVSSPITQHITCTIFSFHNMHSPGRSFPPNGSLLLSLTKPAASSASHCPCSPLVAPGKPSLLDFNNDQPDMNGGMHFNLYNNIWGTNFPMWYDEDARFRFRLRIGK